jgi:hypothetical protein
MTEGKMRMIQEANRKKLEREEKSTKRRDNRESKDYENDRALARQRSSDS